VQLGWLYLDTIAILRKFTAAKEDYIHVRNVMDLAELERAIRPARADRIAGVMAEVPTNPLVQTPDVAALAALCRRHSVKLVLDPSLVSAFSADCLPHADLVVTSLTKYTGNEGTSSPG
jgi:cystathionine gamma-synthase